MRLTYPTLAAVLLATSLPACGQESYSKLRSAGPATIAITYKCDAGPRVALREYMLQTGLARFEGWKGQGILKEYRILFNSYLDSDTYDMLSLLTFNRYSDVGRWREIEKTMPAGLLHDGLKLVSSAVTYSLDSIRHAASPQKPARGRSVFFIIPYDFDPTPPEDYVKYLDGYVIPQVTGWMKEDVVASYNMFLSRYPTSRPWGSLFVLEYRDSDAFGLREATVSKVRMDLQGNPAWKALSDSKHKIRVEKQTVIAQELVLP